MRAAILHEEEWGAGVLKLFATHGVATRDAPWDAPDLSVELMTCAVEMAHARHLRVAAHALGAAGIRNALAAGVDTIEHGIGLDAEMASQMADRGTALVPTLSIYERASVTHPDATVRWRAGEVIHQFGPSIESALRAGVIIATGTDQGLPWHPVTGPATEAAALRAAGLSAVEVLRAATVGSATAIGLRDYDGCIAVGRPADFILVRGDPSSDVSALARVQAVFYRGKKVH
jgi:imidazolonepropionase-like amidohydrolase